MTTEDLAYVDFFFQPHYNHPWNLLNQAGLAAEKQRAEALRRQAAEEQAGAEQAAAKEQAAAEPKPERRASA